MKTHTGTASSFSPDEIRDRFNPQLPDYRAYINAFQEHNHELVQIFSAHPDILLMWNDLMNDFNTNESLAAKVSKQSNDRMKAILDEVYRPASADLKQAIDKHKSEIDHFPDTMAFLLFSFYFF